MSDDAKTLDDLKDIEQAMIDARHALIKAMAVNWGGPNEQPTDRCSVCERPFKQDDVPLCTWSSEGWAARFCDPCAEKYIEVEKHA